MNELFFYLQMHLINIVVDMDQKFMSWCILQVSLLFKKFCSGYETTKSHYHLKVRIEVIGCHHNIFL